MDQKMPFNDWKIKVEHAKRTTASQVMGTMHADQSAAYSRTPMQKHHSYQNNNRDNFRSNDRDQDRDRYGSRDMGGHQNNSYNNRSSNVNRQFSNDNRPRDGHQSNNFQ